MRYSERVKQLNLGFNHHKTMCIEAMQYLL